MRLFLFAHALEAFSFRQRNEPVFLTGQGRDAAEALDTFLKITPPTELINCGICGVINPDLELGKVFKVDSYNQKEARGISLLTVETPLESCEGFEEFDLVDMEGAFLKEIADKYKIPFSSYKIGWDRVGDGKLHKQINKEEIRKMSALLYGEIVYDKKNT